MSDDQKGSKHKTRYFIKYHPELKRFFGSQEAALIFEKLEYWSSKYSDGFWKFFEPCTHPLYKRGDSWQEELEISRKVFRRAFITIGTHYKSKSVYLDQSDPFQGKMYASYYDRKTNRTYFLRNHQRVQDFLCSFWQGVKKLVSKVTSKICKTGSYRNGPLGNSFMCANKDNISLQRSTSSQDVTLNSSTSSPPKPQIQSLPVEIEEEKDKNMKVAEDMLKIWNDVTSNRQTLRSNLKIKLPQALRESFQGSLDSWTEFCMKVASSKFLMGEAYNSKFKAYLAWLIKPETIEAINDKYFSLEDREVTYRPLFLKLKQTLIREELQGTERWKDICEQLSHKLSYATFKAWFKDVKLLNEETSQPTLQCPTRFMRDWIQTHYQGDLERIIREGLPHITSLNFDVQ